MKHKFCWPTLEAALHKVLPPRSSVKRAQLLQPVLRSIAMDAGVVGALALGPRPSSRRRRSAASCIVEGDPCPTLSWSSMPARCLQKHHRRKLSSLDPAGSNEKGES